MDEQADPPMPQPSRREEDGHCKHSGTELEVMLITYRVRQRTSVVKRLLLVLMERGDVVHSMPKSLY